MKDKDVANGVYRVKKGLPHRCWNEISLTREQWEGKMVRVVGTWDDKWVVPPDDENGCYVTAWRITMKGKPGNWWLPAYALESACMFRQ